MSSYEADTRSVPSLTPQRALIPQSAGRRRCFYEELTGGQARLTAVSASRRPRRTLAAGAAGLLILIAVVAVVLSSTGALRWPWQTTSSAAPPPTSLPSTATPEEVTRAYMDARVAGDTAGAHKTYWVPEVTTEAGYAATTDVTDVTIGAAKPLTTEALAEGWQQAVEVHLGWMEKSDATLGWSGWVILVRNSDPAPWRILSVDTVH